MTWCRSPHGRFRAGSGVNSTSTSSSCRALLERRPHRRAVTVAGHDHAQQQPVVHHDLLDVRQLRAVRGQHVEQRRGHARAVLAGDGQQQAHPGWP
jgi:hypothetical protein